jgi:hypothetical protein
MMTRPEPHGCSTLRAASPELAYQLLIQPLPNTATMPAKRHTVTVKALSMNIGLSNVVGEMDMTLPSLDSLKQSLAFIGYGLVSK